jgi:hypothetical protein
MFHLPKIALAPKLYHDGVPEDENYVTSNQSSEQKQQIIFMKELPDTEDQQLSIHS